MKAYKGTITGPLATQTDTIGARTVPKGTTGPSAASNEKPYIAPALSRPADAASDTTTRRVVPAQDLSESNTVLHLAVVVTLAILAFALAVYLLAR